MTGSVALFCSACDLQLRIHRWLIINIYDTHNTTRKMCTSQCQLYLSYTGGKVVHGWDTSTTRRINSRTHRRYFPGWQRDTIAIVPRHFWCRGIPVPARHWDTALDGKRWCHRNATASWGLCILPAGVKSEKAEEYKERRGHRHRVIHVTHGEEKVRKMDMKAGRNGRKGKAWEKKGPKREMRCGRGAWARTICRFRLLRHSKTPCSSSSCQQPQSATALSPKRPVKPLSVRCGHCTITPFSLFTFTRHQLLSLMWSMEERRSTKHVHKCAASAIVKLYLPETLWCHNTSWQVSLMAAPQY